MNLIGNAIEYNHPNGTIELSAKLAVDQLILKVSDTGVGIKPEDLPHVFEAFFRADPSRKQDDGHLGLGLSMVQAHAKAMNGECKVESEFGKGTMFAIAIPQ